MRSKSASCCLPFERLGRQGSLALHRPRNANCSQAPREPMSLNSLVQKILPVPRRRQAPPPQDLPETPHHRPRRTFDPQRLLRHRFRGEFPYCRHQTCCRPTSPYRPPRARRARPERSTRARWESAHRMQGGSVASMSETSASNSSPRAGTAGTRLAARATASTEELDFAQYPLRKAGLACFARLATERLTMVQPPGMLSVFCFISQNEMSYSIRPFTICTCF